MPASDPTALLADLDRRIAKAQRARDAIEGHGGSASGQPEDVVTLGLEEARDLAARLRKATEPPAIPLADLLQELCEAAEHQMLTKTLGMESALDYDPRPIREIIGDIAAREAAAHRAGQEAMRERAANEVGYYARLSISADIAARIAAAIRALPTRAPEGA